MLDNIEIEKMRIMDRLFEVYKKTIQYKSPFVRFEKQMQLRNIGLTSLSTLILIIGIEKEFEVFIDLEYLLEQIKLKEQQNDVNIGYTIEDLVNYIYELQQN